MYDLINKNFINKKLQIKKLRNKFIANLSKDENEELWNTEISEILKNNKISLKYNSNEWTNKKMVEKIENNKDEVNVLLSIQNLPINFFNLFISYNKIIQ